MGEAAESENKRLWKEANVLQEKKDELMRKNTKIDEDNEMLQKQFSDITAERNKIVENDKIVNTRYQVIHQNLESVCDERKNLRTISNTIDEEHHRLKTLFEDFQKEGKDVN